MLNLKNDATLGYFSCFVSVSADFEDRRDTWKGGAAEKVVKEPLGNIQQPITWFIGNIQQPITWL